MTNQFKIFQVQVLSNQESLRDVVYSVKWGYGDFALSRIINGEIELNPPSLDDFVPLADISEETLLEWTLEVIGGVELLEERLSAALKPQVVDYPAVFYDGKLTGVSSLPVEKVEVLLDSSGGDAIG